MNVLSPQDASGHGHKYARHRRALSSDPGAGPVSSSQLIIVICRRRLLVVRFLWLLRFMSSFLYIFQRWTFFTRSNCDSIRRVLNPGSRWDENLVGTWDSPAQPWEWEPEVKCIYIRLCKRGTDYTISKWFPFGPLSMLTLLLSIWSILGMTKQAIPHITHTPWLPGQI